MVSCKPFIVFLTKTYRPSYTSYVPYCLKTFRYTLDIIHLKEYNKTIPSVNKGPKGLSNHIVAFANADGARI